MGSVLAELIAAQADMRLVAGIEAFGHPAVGRPLGTGFIGSELGKVIDGCDAVVDFSTPQSSLANLRIAANQGRPYVLGTTGFTAVELEEVRDLSRLLPLAFAPNFSVGVNVLYRLVAEAASVLRDGYDIEIVEVHHRKKKDAPSGTAKQLAEIAARASGGRRIAYGRHGQTGERPGDEIGVHSVRTGDVTGEHTVILGTDGERLELTHKASNRMAFAQGAVRALRFISGKPSGMYDMNDVLARHADRSGS